MLEDKRVAFLILAALNWAMQVQSVIPLDPAARSHRPFSMSGLLPNLAKTGESQHTNCLWSWVLLEGWRHTSYENNCVQVYKGLLSASPTHLAFVRFLKPLAKADQTTLLHWSQLAQISLNVISIQFVSWKKKKRTIQRTLDIARKETWSYFYTSGYLWFTLEEHRSPNFSCPRKVSDILTVMRAWGHRQHIRYQS